MKVRRKLGDTLCSILFKEGLQSHTILSETRGKVRIEGEQQYVSRKGFISSND